MIPSFLVMRIGVFGSGAVGGYFGGRLAQSGQDVAFIARGRHLNAIREKGLRVQSLKGDFVIHPANAVDDPSQIGVVDVVLVAVKTWQIPHAAEAIKPMVGPETMVVPLQNGVEARDQLAAVLGQHSVIGGLCRIISLMVEPGHIKHAGGEPSIAFAEWDNQPSQRVEGLRQAFESAQVHAQVPSNIQTAIWEKFIFIAPVSGVGAASRVPIGVLRSVPETRNLIERAMQEIFDVAIAKGIQLSSATVSKIMGFIDNLPADGTASMQRDLMEGRPSELEAQNGAVVRIGQEVGVPTPVNEFLYATLLPTELNSRSSPSAAADHKDH